jgi:ABC-type lipoprotein export system ATPase subunit
MSQTPMIEVQGLTKHYRDAARDAPVLHDLSLTIPRGALVSIVGRSGSGKTTLLNVIGGLDRDWSGQVRVDGQALASLSDRRISALRNRTIGFVFQFHNLLMHLSCEENVLLPAHFAAGGVTSALKARARWALERVGLPGVGPRRPTRLSGGEQQRVAVARAILFQPALMLCDEPTGSLDKQSSEQVVGLFEELSREDGTTVVVVTHEEWVAARTGRVVRVTEGRVVEDD